MGTRSSTDQRSFFTESKEARDARCVEKDLITKEILRDIRISDPKAFTAVLMPSLYGPEVQWLQDRGVPARNIFSIERAPNVHAKYLRPTKGFAHFRGMRTTSKPLAANFAIDHIPFPKVNFVYLDFFGQPDSSHLTTLYKLFKLGHVQRGSRLIVTFGANRGEPFSCQLNSRLRGAATTGLAYVDAALGLAEREPYKSAGNYVYMSNLRAKFVVTEVRF